MNLRHGQALTEAPETGSIRVMVVDDNDGFRESLVALLHAGGLRVVAEARSGAEALGMVAGAEPDIVLMDVRMPGMDGIETTRRLKSIRPSTGVVALTAQEDDTIVREMLVSGASGYVLKDSDGEDILNAVAQAALGGAVLSPGVTPAVIEQLTEALAGERLRARELEEAHVALVERAARRHELVARLGHELRTPVTVILGIARTLAERRVAPSEQAELLRRLASRAGALARLVERFESVMDTGSEDLIDLQKLAREVSSGEPRVGVEAGPGVPKVVGNSVLARRILEELFDNACRFSAPETEVVATIERGEGMVSVTVTDHGGGIKPEDRDRIFEPLEQGEALDARTHQGAGMGLSLARAAARAMGGDLVLQGSSPSGSTFLWSIDLEEE